MTFCAYCYTINVRTESEVITMSPRTGRPKTDNPMNDRLYVRVTKEEKEEIIPIIFKKNFTDIDSLTDNVKLRKILMFYKNYRADIANPKSELYKLKQEFEGKKSK